MEQPEVAAEYMGLKVPNSPFLHEKRIARINAGAYEGQEIAGALKVVRAGDRVLEMGAGIGFVGGVVARNAKPARLVAFEANPALIPHIRALHALNGLEDVAEVRNEVLVGGPDRPATMAFHRRTSFLGSSLLKHERAVDSVDIPTAALDAVMDEVKPDAMLIDIEGGELDILRHIDLSGVRAMVIEFHPEAYGIPGMQECKRILRQAGLGKLDGYSTRTVWTCERGAA